MDTTPPSLPPPLPTPGPPPFRDAHGGLIAFGVIEIVLGAFAVLTIPSTLFGQFMIARRDGHAPDWSLVAPTIAILAAIAGGLIWLGIGSLRARRWARALLVCFGAMGLCYGVVALAALIPVLRNMDELFRQQNPPLPPAAALIAKIVAVATCFVMYVAIPGAILLFYRRPNVKLTCEARDPVVRWTDRCPLPVLAMCIVQVGSSACLLLMGRYAAYPIFGYIVTGWPARPLWLGFVAFSLYSARGFYRLCRRVWLVYTVVLLALSVSSIATFLHGDLIALYQAAGMPEWELKQVARSPLIRSNLFVWYAAVGALIYGGYLLYLGRYFCPDNASAPAE